MLILVMVRTFSLVGFVEVQASGSLDVEIQAPEREGREVAGYGQY